MQGQRGIQRTWVEARWLGPGQRQAAGKARRKRKQSCRAQTVGTAAHLCFSSPDARVSTKRRSTSGQVPWLQVGNVEGGEGRQARQQRSY